MERCWQCECSPCFLDCEERRQRGQRERIAEWRFRQQQGGSKELLPSERKVRLAMARRMLRSGVEHSVIAEATGLRLDHIHTIAYRQKHGITGGRRRTAKPVSPRHEEK